MAFAKIRDNSPKYVFSLDKKDTSRNGITHINFIDFLMNKVDLMFYSFRLNFNKKQKFKRYICIGSIGKITINALGLSLRDIINIPEEGVTKSSLFLLFIGFFRL